MNSAVELHDSWITRITPSRDSISVRFQAYIHRSHERPGLDSGTGWTQDVVLEVADFTLESGFTELPQQLDVGLLQVDGRVLDYVIPIPLAVQRAVRFSARSISGENLIIKGTGAKLVALGEPCVAEYYACLT